MPVPDSLMTRRSAQSPSRSSRQAAPGQLSPLRDIEAKPSTPTPHAPTTPLAPYATRPSVCSMHWRRPAARAHRQTRCVLRGRSAQRNGGKSRPAISRTVSPRAGFLLRRARHCNSMYISATQSCVAAHTAQLRRRQAQKHGQTGVWGPFRSGFLPIPMLPKASQAVLGSTWGD